MEGWSWDIVYMVMLLKTNHGNRAVTTGISI